MVEQASILLVDDHPIVRQGLAFVINMEADLHICGEAESVETAVEAAGRLQPALALVDLSLDGRPDVELIRQLRQMIPPIRVLVLSMHDEAVWAPRALEAGACGYVMKQESAQLLMRRIRQALRGETAVSETVAAALIKQLTWGRDASAEEEKPTLGERELQVLHLLGKGQTSREIAEALQISIKTVGSHREHLKQKLGLRSAAELMHYAVRQAGPA